MKAQRYHSVALAVLCSALVLLSGDVVAQSTSSSPSYECNDNSISDGDCDLDNNNEDCGYDGGDCCECTCIDTDAYECGVRAGFSCLDPSASCYVATDDDTEETSSPSTSSPVTPSPITSPVTPSPMTPSVTPSPITTQLTPSPVTRITPSPTTTPTSAPVSPDTPSPIASTPSPTTASPSTAPTSTSSTPCDAASVSDGNCDLENNSLNCGYDGGDCCDCTCVSTTAYTCGDSGYDCVDPDSSCDVDYVEAGTKTTVTASANAYDERPGADNDSNGCFIDGCEPSLTRDGITDDVESRWSCAAKIVPGELECSIDFIFEDPQDIKDVQVSFYKGDERSRSLQAAINGEVVGEFDSYTGSTFNSFAIQGEKVETLTLTSVGLSDSEWISIIEVRFMVEA